MKPNIVPNCIRTESYMITFEVEEEKYISPYCINCMLCIAIYLAFSYNYFVIYLNLLMFPGFHYLERNTSWNSLMMSLLKPIAWFIFQVSSGFLLFKNLWFTVRAVLICVNALWLFHSPVLPSKYDFKKKSLILFRLHTKKLQTCWNSTLLYNLNFRWNMWLHICLYLLGSNLHSWRLK